MLTYLLTLAICSFAILLFDAIGAMASRILDFNYIMLTPLSFVLYLGIGMYATIQIDDIAGITTAGIVGMIESVWGLQIANRFNANWGDFDIDSMEDEMHNPFIIIFMVSFCMFIGWLGTLLV